MLSKLTKLLHKSYFPISFKLLNFLKTDGSQIITYSGCFCYSGAGHLFIVMVRHTRPRRICFLIVSLTVSIIMCRKLMSLIWNFNFACSIITILPTLMKKKRRRRRKHTNPRISKPFTTDVGRPLNSIHDLLVNPARMKLCYYLLD